MKIPKKDRSKFDFNLPFGGCLDCPLYIPNETYKVANCGWGVFDSNEPIKYIFIVDKGSQYGYALGGKDGDVFQKEVLKLGFEQFYILPVSLCRPSDGKTGLNEAFVQCQDNTDFILKIITETNKLLGAEPPRIMILGLNPLKRFFSDKEVLKLKLNELRVKTLKTDKYPDLVFYTTYAPASLMRNPDWLPFFQLDLEIFRDGKQQDTIDDNSYFLVDNMDMFHGVLDIMDSSDIYAFDIESSGTKYVPMWNLKKRKVKRQTVFEKTLVLDTWIGISFSNERESGCYIPTWVKGKVIKGFFRNHKPVLKWHENYKDYEDDEFYFWLGEDNKDEVLNRLKEVLENPKTKKIAQNGKFDCTFLEARQGIKVANFWFDTMYAQHVLDENALKGLDAQANRYIDLRGYKKDVFAGMSKDDLDEEKYANIPLEQVWIYGAKDTDLTYRLYEDLYDEIKQKTKLSKKKKKAYYDGEKYLFDFYMPLDKIYAKAEMVGLPFDEVYANEIADRYEKDRTELYEKMTTTLIEAGIDYQFDKDPSRMINFNSADQLRLLLFHPDFLGWPVYREKKSAKDAKKYRKEDIIEWDDASTDKTSMKILIDGFDEATLRGDDKSNEVEFIEDLLEYKRKGKMISTYLRGPKIISRLDEDNMLHYSMKVVGTVGGRLSSSPNVQNLPRKTPEIHLPGGRIKEASNIRGILRAPEGFVLWSSDLSQAELRLMGDYAEDLVLMDYVDRGEDIHWAATRGVFYNDANVEYDKENPDHKKFRKFMKSGNFGRLYGAATPKVLQSMREKLERGEPLPSYQVMEKHGEWFFGTFHRIAEYLEEMEQFILTHGWIDSKFGRRRNLPDAFSDNKYFRAAAVREGINAQIQGTSSDITQVGLIKVDRFIQEKGLRSHIGWSVHDEINGWSPPEEVELLSTTVPELMTEKEDSILPLTKIKIKLESEFETFKTRWGD